MQRLNTHHRRTSRLAALLAPLLCACLAVAGCDDPDAGDTQRASQTSAADRDRQHARPTAVADIPADQSRAGWSKQKNFYVEVTPTPNPIPFQELFELEVRVYESDDGSTPAAQAQLDQVRAVMPAHDHGMKVEPAIKQTEPGVFRVRGMRWHMKGPGEDGHWKLELVLNDGSTIDTATFDLQCCRPGESSDNSTSK